MAIEIRIPSGGRIPNLFRPVDIMEIGNPGMPGELIIHNGALYLYGPNGETVIDGGMISTGAILANSVTAEKLTVGSQTFLHNITWTADDNDSVSWTGGTLQFADGSSTVINSGNTGAITNPAIGTDPIDPTSIEYDGGYGGVNLEVYQSFIAGAANINLLRVVMNWDDSPVYGTVSIKICHDNAGSIGTEIAGSEKIIPVTSFGWNRQTVDIDYSNVNLGLTVGTKYWIKEDFVPGGGNNGVVYWYYRENDYADGEASSNDPDVNYEMTYGGVEPDWCFYMEFQQTAYIYYDGTSTLKVTTDITQVLSDDKLLLAIVKTAQTGSKCTISPIYSAGTTISGDQITTGKIQSIDGKTYFDLINNHLIVNDGSDDRILVGKK